MNPLLMTWNEVRTMGNLSTPNMPLTLLDRLICSTVPRSVAHGRGSEISSLSAHDPGSSEKLAKLDGIKNSNTIVSSGCPFHVPILSWKDL